MGLCFQPEIACLSANRQHPRGRGCGGSKALADERNQDDRDKAGGRLRGALADGEMPAADVLEEGRSNGHMEKPIRKAIKATGAE